jgi:predicted TIM-barrel fold metal-dependent hydrolase
MSDTQRGTTDDSDRLVVISCDSHVGPTLEQMRPYCPAAFADAYAAFTADQGRRFDVWANLRPLIARLDPEEAAARTRELDRNRATAGHFDMDARRRDMDADGVAADVIYHSSQNGEPMPFVTGGSLFFAPTDSATNELAAVGTHIYNEWLADACSTDPDRHLGVAHLPAWDIEKSVREVDWARARGLRAVNLPAPRPGIQVFDHPDWEPFWATCEDLDVTLNTHVGGAGGPVDLFGPQATVLSAIERGGWLSRRALPRLIFGGVLERHPRLRFVLTEQNGDWWSATMREYDSAYRSHAWQFDGQVPLLPSEYCARQVFIGGSYMAGFEARTAVDEGYQTNIMWGSDYPHAEGTFQLSDDPAAPNMTHLALRYAFSAIDPEPTRAMLADNAARVYGFDLDALTEVAGRINAPTASELAVPLSSIPDGTACRAFRVLGPWG